MPTYAKLDYNFKLIMFKNCIYFRLDLFFYYFLLGNINTLLKRYIYVA